MTETLPPCCVAARAAQEDGNRSLDPRLRVRSRGHRRASRGSASPLGADGERDHDRDLLESFLLELGGAFTFVGRQRRLRIGDEWYSVDLLFFHRRLRCLVVIDLKLGKFTHADAGQMHLYLNYAREHWMQKDENPPVGLILCAQKNADVARYALQGLPNKVLAAQYRTALPDEHLLVDEIKKTRLEIERRAPSPRARKSTASKRSGTT